MRARTDDAAVEERFRPQGLDILLSLGIAALTFLAHDVSYILRVPYWLDETWVAVSAVLPLGSIGRVTASTPIGWTLLYRAVPGGDQAGRLLPLAFAALAVVVAYWLIFWLDWPTDGLARFTAILGAFAVLLAPTSLVRNDLKQYTADAFFALLVLTLASGLERNWSRARLIRLGVVIVLGFFFSLAAAVVGGVGFAALLVVLLVRREWPRLGELAVVGGGVAMLLALIYLLAYRPGIAPGLHDYRASYFVPAHDPGAFVLRRATELSQYMGLQFLAFAGGLVLAGVVTCLWLRQPVIALSAPLLVGTMILLAQLRLYPLFDERTSHFVSVVLLVYAVVGVAGICHLLRWIHPGVSAVALLGVAVLFGWHVVGLLRVHSIPVADLRTPTRYVAAHAGPEDVVLLSSTSSWGVAYYWARSAPGTHPVVQNSTTQRRFVALLSREVVAPDRTATAVTDALRTALASGHPVWIIRGPLNASDVDAWSHAFDSLGIIPQQVLGNALLRFSL